MEPFPISLICVILVTASVSSSLTVSGDHLSTVFVLETSDSSDSSPNINESQANSAKDANTHIITDDGLPSSNSDQQQQQSSSRLKQQPASINSQSPNQHQHNNNAPVVRDTHHEPAKQQHAEALAAADRNEQRESNKPSQVLRRVEEESQPVGQGRQRVSTTTRSSNHVAAPHASTSRPKQTSTSSHEEHERNQSTPRSEERLLISITSNEDDEYRPPRQPQQQQHQHHILSSNGGGNSEEPPQKRKPAITISIQDANFIKQNGGSGPSAVIVRPSENGQSIVISTVGVDSGGSHNKYPSSQNSKPPSNDPYREPPAETPVHVINGNGNGNNHQHHHQQHIPSSTHKPQLVSNDNYGANDNHRPIASTLLEQPPRQPPQLQHDEERPQRPVVRPPPPEDYEQRPSSRPVLRPPVQEPPYGTTSESNANTNADYEAARPTAATNGDGSRFPLSEKNCGLVHETRIVGGAEADPDDFLWMAAIVKSRPKDGEVRPFCGGSLITRRHILTAAHCLENLAPRDVLVRLGSYDFDDSTASSLSADFAIDQFRVPAQYSKKTHVADIAIMRLKTPLSTTDNYKTVCMPQPRRSYVGDFATVTGYGSQSQTFRRAAPKLRQVTVPIWENRKCSLVYKRNLTESFLCAGYEEGGKDACQGDSGGPLMAEGPQQRMMIVGVVSHGIGCGSPGYPGVYTRTTTYLDWIEKNTRE